MKPRIYSTAGHAPFQQAWTIDIDHLSYSDRIALKSGLDLDLYGMEHQPFYAWYNDRKLVLMDATEEVKKLLTATCDRWENRHAITHETVALPTISFFHKVKVWLAPAHEAPRALKRLSNVRLENKRYVFEMEFHSTKSAVAIIRQMKDVIKSPSCRGSKMRVRGSMCSIYAGSAHVSHRAHLCASRLTFDDLGMSTAVCPVWLWLASIMP